MLAGVENFYYKQINHDKSLIFKYGRIQRKIPSWLLCGSHGACLGCMLPGVQVTTGYWAGNFFCSYSSFLSDSEDCDSLL